MGPLAVQMGTLIFGRCGCGPHHCRPPKTRLLTRLLREVLFSCHTCHDFPTSLFTSLFVGKREVHPTSLRERWGGHPKTYGGPVLLLRPRGGLTALPMGSASRILLEARRVSVRVACDYDFGGCSWKRPPRSGQPEGTLITPISGAIVHLLGHLGLRVYPEVKPDFEPDCWRKSGFLATPATLFQLPFSLPFS